MPLIEKNTKRRSRTSRTHSPPLSLPSLTQVIPTRGWEYSRADTDRFGERWWKFPYHEGWQPLSSAHAFSWKRRRLLIGRRSTLIPTPSPSTRAPQLQTGRLPSYHVSNMIMRESKLTINTSPVAPALPRTTLFAWPEPMRVQGAWKTLLI
jgi:hypothetical protein